MMPSQKYSLWAMSFLLILLTSSTRSFTLHSFMQHPRLQRVVNIQSNNVLTPHNKRNKQSHGFQPCYAPPPPYYYSSSSSSSSSSSLALAVSPSSIQSFTSTIIDPLFTTTSIVPLLPSFLINSLLFTALKPKLDTMLTTQGFYHALALGTLLWHTLGWKGWTTCVLYLFLGQVVTKFKFKEKEEKGIAEGRGGRRGPENVWGSAATALLCASASLQIHPSIITTTSSSSFFGISYDLLILGYVSSLATKLADTFASEIGKAYGKTTFLITSFERVPPGTEGAISAEGTLAAFIGGSFLPLYAWSIGLMTNNVMFVGIATVAAFLATNAESWIGAALQGKKGFEWMTNEVVNFINTVIGATIAIVLETVIEQLLKTL